MFNEAARRVNLSGRSGSSSLQSNRSALLEQSRRERAARHSAKEQQQAALRLQAFVRARQQRTRLHAQQRRLFDDALPHTMAEYRQQPQQQPQEQQRPHPPPPPQLQHAARGALLLLVRRFLLFYSPRVQGDRVRWAQLQALLSLALRAQQQQPLLRGSLHYGSLLLSSASERATWVHQARRLVRLLLLDIGDVEGVNDGEVHSAVFLLYQLLAAAQWSVYPTTARCVGPIFVGIPGASSPVALQSAVLSAQLLVLQRLLFVHSPPYARRSAPSFSAQQSPTLSWHAALRARLLHMGTMDERPSAESASPAASSPSPAPLPQHATATKNALGLLCLLMALPMQLALSATPSALPSAFAGSFVAFVLSIPLLSARLRAFGLSALLGKVVDPALVHPALTQLLEQRAADDGAQFFASSGVSSALSLALSAVSPARSFSSWDGLTHPQQPLLSSPPSLRAAGMDGNEEAPAAEDSDADIDVDVDGPIAAASAEPCPASLWLLGNLAEWMPLLLPDSDGSAAQQWRLSALLNALEALVTLTPAQAFPSSASQTESSVASVGRPHLPPPSRVLDCATSPLLCALCSPRCVVLCRRGAPAAAVAAVVAVFASVPRPRHASPAARGGVIARPAVSAGRGVHGVRAGGHAAVQVEQLPRPPPRPRLLHGPHPLPVGHPAQCGQRARCPRPVRVRAGR